MSYLILFSHIRRRFRARRVRAGLGAAGGALCGRGKQGLEGRMSEKLMQVISLAFAVILVLLAIVTVSISIYLFLGY